MSRHRNASIVAVACVCIADLAPAQAPLWRWEASAPSDDFGWSVRFAGDVDSDGSGDVVIGSPSDDAAGASTGAAFVFSGRTGSLLWSFHGEVDGDGLGYSVDGAFDANGDGRPDLVTGSRFNGAYVFSGADGQTLHHFTGNPATGFGNVVAALGDVDADGCDDLAVGAPFDDSGGTDAGKVYVYSGRDGAELHAFTGSTTFAWLGHAITRCGDLDHDGHADLVIGAPSQSGPAYTAAYSGADASELWRIDDSGNPGFSLSSAGDWDVDGTEDVVFGDPGVAAHGTNSGKATVVSGVDGAILAEFFGTRDFASFGESVRGGLDVDDDGVPDLLVGAPNDYRIVGERVGSGQIFSGRTGRLLFTFYGDDIDEKFGHDVALIEDMDGDSMADMAVGAYRDLLAGSNAGSVESFAGNDLYLKHANLVVRETYPLELFIRDGVLGAPYVLFLAEMDSTPLWIAIEFGFLDAVGEATFSATVPKGFGAHELLFQAFACGDPAAHRGVEDSWFEQVFTIQ